MKYKDKEIVIVCPSYKRPVVETLKYIPFLQSICFARRI